MRSITLLLLAALLAQAAPVFKPCEAGSVRLHNGAVTICGRRADIQSYANAKRSIQRTIFARQDDDFDDGSDDSGFDDGSFDDSDAGFDDSGEDDDSGFDDNTDLDVGDSGFDDGSVDTGDDTSLDAGDESTVDDGAADSGSVDSSDDGSDTTDDAEDGLDDADAGLDATDDVTDATDDGTVDANDNSTDGTDTSTDPESTDADATDDNTDGSDIAGASNSTDTSDTTGTEASGDSTDDSADTGATNSTTAATPSSSASDSAASAPADSSTAVDPSASSAASTSGTCAQSATAPNDATVAVIKQFEGFVPSPKPDPIGLPTVGFGHKCIKANCAEVPFSFPLSQTTATTLLQTDAQKFVGCIHGFLGKSVTLNDNQFGALTAFTFNLGCGTLQKSTLLKRLNNGEDPNTVAAQEIPKFNKAGGKVLAGLTRRRAAEVSLFQTPSSTVANPLC